jgi:hypothetical protein
MHPHKLTPTQQQIVEMLADGRPHLVSEVESGLCSNAAAVQAHICKLRKRLRENGQGIERETCYRLVKKN